MANEGRNEPMVPMDVVSARGSRSDVPKVGDDDVVLNDVGIFLGIFRCALDTEVDIEIYHQGTCKLLVLSGITAK